MSDNPVRFQRPSSAPEKEQDDEAPLPDRPISSLGRKSGYEEYGGGRPGPTLTVEVGPGRKIILPYMAFQQAIFRNHEIFIEFATAQVIVEAKEGFSIPEFLEAVGAMRLQSITNDPDFCAVRVLLDLVEPKEETL